MKKLKKKGSAEERKYTTKKKVILPPNKTITSIPMISTIFSNTFFVNFEKNGILKPRNIRALIILNTEKGAENRTITMRGRKERGKLRNETIKSEKI